MFGLTASYFTKTVLRAGIYNMTLEETVITQSLFLHKFQLSFERFALETVASWEDMITFTHHTLVKFGILRLVRSISIGIIA